MKELPKDKAHLILGSASPRRKELLGHLGIPFEIRPADIDEERATTCPRELVETLAKDKAQAILESADLPLNPWIITADTTVCLDNKIYNKPRDRAHAQEMLLELSGKTHQVYTGVGIATRDGIEVFSVLSQVTFNPISPELLKYYLDSKESLDKAGAYGIQGPGLLFISSLNGSYSNVVGLPLSDLVDKLQFLIKKSCPEIENWRYYFNRDC